MTLPRRLLILALALAIGCAPAAPPVHVPPPPPPPPVHVIPTGDVASALLALHNVERAKAGLPPYRGNPKLVASAQSHATHMAVVGKLAHFGIGDGDPWTRISAAGYVYSAASENAAAGQRTVVEVMADWMDEPPTPTPNHRSTILGPYTEMGGAVATAGNGMAYWCVDFGKP